MADTTVTLDGPGVGGSTIDVDDIGGTVTPYSKLKFGPSGTATHVTASVGLPVDIKASTTLTETNSGTIAGDTTSIDGKITACNTGAVVISSGTVTANAGTGDYLSVAGHTRNEAFKESMAIGGELDDTTPVVATEGNVSPARITAQRALHANLRSNDGTELGTTGNPVIVTDDGSAILVDGSAVTQPVSAASLPLPTGAATAAAQLPDGHNVTVDNAAGASAVNIQDGGNKITVDWNGTDPPIGAGTEAAALRVTMATDSTGQMTVDGTVTANAGTGTFTVDNAGTFATQVNGDALTALQKIDNIAHAGSDVALSEHVPISGQFDDVATTAVTENQVAPVRINSARALHVDGSGVTQPVSGTVTANPASGTIDTVTTVSTVTNLSQLGGQAVSMNTGVRDAGTQRVTIATNDSVPVTGTVTANLGTIADVATQTTLSALNAKFVTGTDIGDVDVTSISAGTNLIGDVGLSGARTSGGTTLFMDPDLDETKVEVKATGGQIYWIHAMNLTAAVLFLKFWNLAAASVTVGTTTPHLIFPLATQGDTNGAGFTLSIPNGIALGTGITMACVTSVLDAGNTGPAANGCVVNLGYA